MTHLLDTDICIYWLNGHPEIREQALTVGLSSLAISSITVAELYFGAYNSNRIEQNLARAEQFVGAIAIIPPTPSTLKIFGEMMLVARLDWGNRLSGGNRAIALQNDVKIEAIAAGAIAPWN